METERKRGTTTAAQREGQQYKPRTIPAHWGKAPQSVVVACSRAQVRQQSQEKEEQRHIAADVADSSVDVADSSADVADSQWWLVAAAGHRGHACMQPWHASAHAHGHSHSTPPFCGSTHDGLALQ
eukprot:COSAG01_NODE_21401_length_904_cov_0.611180_1_plen_125_part_10